MSKFKDLFSGHASDYKCFRPTYPRALFEFIAEKSSDCQAAWDCGTGNGQGAIMLAEYFAKVFATDPSQQQIEHAEVKDGVIYSVAPAEQSHLANQSVSVVTVFQALHWFDLDAFRREVQRVCKPNGLLVVAGYNTAIMGILEVDQVYQDFCFDYLWEKGCWAMERDALNNHYNSVNFPFDEIDTPHFDLQMMWNYHDYINYLNTWSAVKTYQKKYQNNPVTTFVEPKIKRYWPDPEVKRPIKFPMTLRIWRVSG